MSSRPRILAACAALAFLALGALGARAQAGSDPKLAFERYRLDNGLEVILHQDRSVPLVAVDVWYHVGSGDETPGKSGFAHLFEHMMFQGTKHTGEDAHFNVLRKIGASNVNGSTNSDRTNYFEVVPSHQLETALWLESDRMGYLLDLLNETSLANQRDVVRNERRQNYDNVPYGMERFAINAALYPEGHPYRYLTIGRHEDLAAASLDDVKGFFRQWYVPANATLTLAGDFEAAAARKLVDKWFASFPPTVRPPHQEVAPPPVTATHRDTLSDNFAKLRRVRWVWNSPRAYAPGDAELDIVANALGRSGTGRLYKILVHDQELAQSVACYQNGAGFSGQFHVSVDLKKGADMGAVERILAEEIERVRNEPITKREFERVLVENESRLVWGLEPILPRAEALQRYNHFVGTPDYFTQDLDRFRKTTVEKVRDAAAQYLQPQGRVEIVTLPATNTGGQ